MFISQPLYEFPAPPGLCEPGVQHWRLIEVALRTPWFVLTVDCPDDMSGDVFTHTLCIATQHDLAELLSSIVRSKVRELVCMLPGGSASSHWTSRSIKQVWLISTSAGEQFVSLRAADGTEINSDLLEMFSTQITQRELLLQLR